MPDEKTGHTCVINDAGNCYTCGERGEYFRVIEPPFDARAFGCERMPACSRLSAEDCGHHGHTDTKPFCDAPICGCVCHNRGRLKAMPSGHNEALTGPEASRRAKAQILPPPVPEGETVSSEADVIRVWSLDDDPLMPLSHCQRCHAPEGPMSYVAVGNRIVPVCCYVTEAFMKATGQLL